MLTPARLLLVLALTLVTLAGCEQRSDEPGAAAGGPTTHASPPDGMPPAPIAGSDREFLIEAAKTGLAGAEASQLVAERSTDPAVRSFAERLLTDLAEKNDELAHLAALKGLTLPAAPGADKGAWWRACADSAGRRSIAPSWRSSSPATRQRSTSTSARRRGARIRT